MFYECRFPSNVSYGAIGGAGWSTRVSDGDGGYRDAQQMWTQPRGRWTVTHECKYPQEWAELIAFHRLMQGKLHGFRFQDWSDYEANFVNGATYMCPDGLVRLAKLYTVYDPLSGIARTDWRIITKPQPYTVEFNTEGVVLDYTTGTVTGATPEATVWRGFFDVPCRFDSDLPQMQYDSYGHDGGIVSWHGVEIVELPPDEIGIGSL